VEQLTDERLMDRLKQGDPQVLDDLYRRHARKIFAFFRSAGGLKSTQDCEDAVHDVFMRVIRGAATFDASKASFRTWVLRIARNHAIDMMRSRYKEATIPIAGPSDGDTDAEKVISEDAIPDTGEGADISLIRSMTAEAVRECIGEIENPDERQAIVLYYLYDKVYREIGEILGESTSMARNRIKAAQARVKACLERKGITGW
jgi:RNA polymerase sigma-70 factor (ECF subfamily)